MSLLFPVLALLLHVYYVQGQCPDYWTRFQSSCYFLFEDLQEWTQANSECQNYHGHLAILETPEEDTFVRGYIGHKQVHREYVLIGLNDIMQEGDYRWVGTNDKATFADWSPGEPNNANGGGENCVVIRPGGSGWIDAHCYDRHHYMCERSPDDGIVC